MKVRMKMQMSGTRDGRLWPARGETVDLSDDEGAKLCASGIAEPVAEEPNVEKAVVPDDSEKRAAPERADEKAPEAAVPPKPQRRRGQSDSE